MATRKRKTTAKKTLTKKFQGSLRHKLTDANKKDISKLADSAVMGDIIQSLADCDLKVSIRYEHEQHHYRCDLYRAYNGYPDSGYMYTGRHVDPVVALVAAYYVFWVIWDKQMPIESPEDYNY